MHVAGGPVKVWATTAGVVLINKASRANDVAVALPEPGAAHIEWLRAPSAGATAGVTLGGVSVAPTGLLPAPRLQPVSPVAGRFLIDLPPASAALLTP